MRGGSTVTGYFPGNIEDVADKFRVARSTVRKIWRRYCDNYTENPLPTAGGNPGKLTDGDLQLIEALKTRRGSITLKEIYEELEVIGEAAGNASISAICRAIKNKMPSGKTSARGKRSRTLRKRGLHHKI